MKMPGRCYSGSVELLAVSDRVGSIFMLGTLQELRLDWVSS